MTSTTSHLSQPAVLHRPFGIEHPYATSADQRRPVRPEAGQAVHLGVVCRLDVSAVACEWERVGAPATILQLRTVDPDATDAAALAGGDGHLAGAQAAQLTSAGGWEVESPTLEAGARYRYRFVAQTPTAAGADGTRSDTTPWFEVSAGVWVADGGHLTLTDRALTRSDEDETGLVTDHPRLVPGSVRWLRDADGVHRVRFALRLEPTEHVVGFGERFDAVDQRGRHLDAVVFEQYKSQGRHGRTYLPMPFAHVIDESGEPGWGLHVRTARRTWFDVGASEPDQLVVEAALEGAASEALDVAVYHGAAHEVLHAFGDEVGRAELLPEWVFRLWASGNEWNTQQIVMSRMDSHRDLAIPVGAVVIEAWSDEEGITIFRDAQYEVNLDGAAHEATDFTYPPDGAWPDPRAMIDELHERGIKVILWQIPLQKTEFDLGPDVGPDSQVLADARAMVDGGHAVLEADGSPYHNRGWWFPQALLADLTTPRSRDWWTAKRRYLVEDLDVDGFKTDGGEHAWGHDLRYGDGRRGDEGNNLYPVHYARTFGDLLRSCGKAPVTFSRAGFTGSQAHGIFWAGDEDSTWEAFTHSVTAGITAAACGIVYWGWDLAGFSGPVPDSELYLRATAAATFMPIMQYHSEFNHHRRPLRDRTPWFVAETNGDPGVVDTFRRYAELRERLVPYLSEQAAATVATSRPLMRGLFFDHPGDAAVWDHPGQFLLGDDLLVNPVTSPGAVTWSTYLPAGTWVDVWTGATHAGAQITQRDVPRDVVPVYCRAERWDALRGVFEA
ncbi:MAG TPA: TIM-barrel domain-containing protein [Cellulomonas sp.]|uniref:glycoside hydrolase family 31 protein n=1 Tax=Cellulomonas sp. TaxID=40001 RepID=UPI002E325861|nr:TIM-barrel domain-containing protein [Cellulomonas sp.]HEX5333386.1 TIM-barrel domain-containing protein [Cellulomonas sp.]